MGRPVMPYSHVMEPERERLKPFRRALSKEDQQAFHPSLTGPKYTPAPGSTCPIPYIYYLQGELNRLVVQGIVSFGDRAPALAGFTEYTYKGLRVSKISYCRFPIESELGVSSQITRSLLIQNTPHEFGPLSDSKGLHDIPSKAQGRGLFR